MAIITQNIGRNKKTYYHINNDTKVESNNELEEINFKNCIHYHFDDTININDLNLDNSLLDDKTWENILSYDVAYKILYGAKPLRIIFVKEDKFIRKDDRSEYLGLFHSNEKHG